MIKTLCKSIDFIINFILDKTRIMAEKKRKYRQRTRTGPKGLWKEDMPDRAYKLALLGLNDKQIATALEIAPATLEYWKDKFPSFRDALENGKFVADAEVAKALYQRATGYQHQDTVILSNRVTYYDDNGKPTKTVNEPLIIPYTKKYPPDTIAAKLWLSARQGNIWQEVQKHEHSGGIDHQHYHELDLKDLSDEDLKFLDKIGAKHMIKDSNNNNN